MCPAVERRRDANEEEEGVATGEVAEPLSAVVFQSRPRWTTGTGRVSYSSSIVHGGGGGRKSVHQPARAGGSCVCPEQSVRHKLNRASRLLQQTKDRFWLARGRRVIVQVQAQGTRRTRSGDSSSEEGWTSC